MPRTIFSHSYDRFRQLLEQARKDAGLTQVEVAAKLRRTQSFVSDYERGERRLDVIEFLQIARVLKADPHAILRQLEQG